MKYTPKNRSNMIRLLQEAIAAQVPERGQPPLTDEEIAVLAESRINELPQADRERILRQVAADTEAGELLLQVHEVGLGKKSAATAPSFIRFARPVWVAAACVCLMLSVWRVADPSPSVGPIPPLQPYQGPTSPDYWEQVAHRRQSEWAARDLVRDYALFASAGACLILSIPLAWWVLRSGPGRGKE